MNRDSKQVLWENVSALMERDYGKENLTRLAKEAKFGPGTSTRLKEQMTSVGLDVLDAIAIKFKVRPWHLLVPKLDPANLPVPSVTGEAWHLPEVEKSRYDALSPSGRLLVQGYLRKAIEDQEAAESRKLSQR